MILHQINVVQVMIAVKTLNKDIVNGSRLRSARTTLSGKRYSWPNFVIVSF